MAYDEQVAERVGNALSTRAEAVEKRMFGGIAFMVRGHMCIGVNDRDLMVRVGPEGTDDALALPHARPMDFTGRPMKGFVWVGPAGYEDPSGLDDWLDRALAFVNTLPAK